MLYRKGQLVFCSFLIVLVSCNPYPKGEQEATSESRSFSTSFKPMVFLEDNRNEKIKSIASDFDHLIEEHAKNKHIPGIAYGIVVDNDLIVSGATGFIGSHLAERLIKEGHEVVGIDCFTDYYARSIKEKNLKGLLQLSDFTFLEDNLLEVNLSDLLVGVDYIFHQAAQAGVRSSWGAEFEIYTSNNILATQKLLEACKRLDIRRFIYASSSSVYGDSEELPLREKSLLKPVSPYGVTKLAGEHLCYSYWKKPL